MFTEILRDRISRIRERECIVFKDETYTYGDILLSWQKWNLEIKNRKIESRSIVMVRGDFNVDSIGLMLALIENNSIFVPVSLVVKDISNWQEIAEVTHYFDLEDDEFQRIEIQVKNSLTRELFDLKNPGIILFSSGTTGEPKAMLHNVRLTLQKYEKIGKSFTSIAFLLFDHMGGFNTVLYSLSSGGTIVVPSNRSPEDILRLIEKYQVEILPTTPSFINMLLVSKLYLKFNLASLKTITYGTEPMPQSTLDTLNSLFPNVKLKQTYGVSEVGVLRSKSRNANSLWMKLGDEEHQVEIRDGIMWIKSKMTMMGYLNAESPFDENGWFNTNDMVEVRDGYLKIIGRVSDVINVGGEKVYPNEVESVILSVSGVNEVVVKGESNSFMGNIVTAQILKDENIDDRLLKKEIRKRCNEKLEKYKRPVKLSFTTSLLHNERFKKFRK